MKTFVFSIILVSAPVLCSASTITTHTCHCTRVPENATADLGSSDYVEPPDDVQLAAQQADLLHEPPFNPNFEQEQLAKKLKECFDTTVTVPDLARPDLTRPDVPKHPEVPGRPSVPEPLSALLMAVGMIGLHLRRR